MHRRLFRTAAATVAGACLAATVGAAPAQAAGAITAWTKQGDGFQAAAGSVRFDPANDTFTIKDWTADGAGVFVGYELGSPFDTGEHYWGRGAGTQTVISHIWNPDRSIKVFACLRDDGVIKWNTCGNVMRTTT